ncbi:head GIN domain-containing protein [Xanthovirga aplysinae]|uniref:head GIN domain-containing protein n=1 Tax=Xanthovirga aplysinae TaxID=2529853 RepID=UPI0012BC6FA4|nr:head GIN domain-containing protein [Xanthovirga aplysinae]MTI30538.1 DUF2807 domain-containing protein [Xanthovirga aplysinae]
MKTSNKLLTGAFLFVISGILIFIVALRLNIHPESHVEIKGNGQVIKEERELKDFTQIEVRRGIKVFITQADNFRVEVETDENLISEIMTHVEGDELLIYPTKDIEEGKVRIYVQMPVITNLGVESAAQIRSNEALHVGHLSLNASSAGALILQIDAETVNADVGSAGSCNIKGTADRLTVRVSSAGSFKASDLEANIGDVRVSSAGKAIVNILDEAQYSASSGGAIRYSGPAELNRIRSSSGGRISKY